MYFATRFVGYGGIILLPALIRANHRENSSLEQGTCRNVVRGGDFLILAAVSGGANLVGRYFGYLSRLHCKFRVSQSIIGVTVVICYGTILFKPGLIVASVLMGTAKLVYAMQNTELEILQNDPQYFGTARHTLGASVMSCVGQLGSVVSTTFAAFLSPYIAVLATLVVSVVQVLVVCSMTEVYY